MTENLVLELKTNPDDDRPVFVVGSFNNWKVGDPDFKMMPLKKGLFQFPVPSSLTIEKGSEYKYVREDWNGVELDERGINTYNRIIKKTKGLVEDEVPKWKFPETPWKKEFLPKIDIVSQEFDVANLVRKRRVAALLPYDYDLHPNKTYPVIYLQDGQNLFDDKAPFGNWGVDKRLAKLAEKGHHEVIVIAIDHGGAQRIEEFSPQPVGTFGKAFGKKYVRFLADTLKPLIDSKYRTKHERESTGIGGSSMGGLISLYAAMLYPEVYGNLMIFSPSLWAYNPIYKQIRDTISPNLPLNVYLYGGGKEGAGMVPNLGKLVKALESFGNPSIKIRLDIDPFGQHTETKWGIEFPQAVEWLFMK
jgi:predicted alpha/beta superfamily hydrolase